MLTSLTSSSLWQTTAKDRLSMAAQTPMVCRVAPSPTGHFHLGTLRTALHNYLLAKSSGGRFFLRIDDTDQSRNDPAFTSLIIDSLAKFGIDYSDIHYQSLRKDIHLNAAQRLLDHGLAFRDGDAIRLNDSQIANVPGQFFDLSSGVNKISQTFLDQSKALVLVRSDGQPTYHFASIVDDIDLGVTCILRGADHLANTTKQIIIAQALSQSGYSNAQQFLNRVLFAHVGLITLNGKKLSKRDQQSSLQHYWDSGICPQALLQYVMQLGWGHPDPCFDKRYAITSFSQMPDIFIQGGLRASNGSLNEQKIKSIQSKWNQHNH